MNQEALKEAINKYLEEIRSLTREVREDFPSVHRLRDFVELATSKKVPRSGMLSSGSEYTVHGVGIRATRSNDTEVDVDIDVFGDGAEIFNAWRIEDYLDTLKKNEEATKEEIIRACEGLAQKGVINHQRADWFSLPASTEST